MSEVARLFVSLDARITGLEKGLAKAQAQLELTQRKADQASKGIAASLDKRGKALQQTGKSLTKWVTLPTLALAAGAGKAAVDFESAFAGVRKTVDASERQFRMLERGIRDMSKEVPIAATELAGIAESAGQLGIETPNILRFTRVMADLGVATNLSGEQAATALARLANITQMPQTEFDRLGSTVVALGNNLATTESEIVEMALRIAGAGKQVGLSEAQILSFAGALSSVGIEAQAGGTAISRAFIAIANSVAKGDEKLDEFARVAGKSRDEFTRAFKRDAAGAMIAFIEGLGRLESQGENTFAVLEDLGLADIRLRDALLRASNAGDLFRESIELGNKAWQENTALTKEAEQRYKTTESQIQLLKNSLVDAGISAGTAFLPAITSVAQRGSQLIQQLAHAFAALPSEVQQATVGVLAFAAALGPAIWLIGGFARAAAKLIGPVGAVTRGVGDLVLAFRAGGIGFAASTLASMVGPAGAAALAVGSLATIFGVLASRESAEARAAREVADAKRAQISAMRELAAAEKELSGESINVEQAELDVARARQRVNQLINEGKKGTDEYKQAVLDLRAASMRHREAEEAQATALEKITKARSRGLKEANRAVAIRQRELEAAEAELRRVREKHPGPAVHPQEQKALERVIRARRQYNDVMRANARTQERLAISGINEIRALEGLEPVTRRNRRGLILLNSAIQQLPEKKQIKLLTEDQDAAAKLGELASRVRRLTSQRYVTRILAQSGSAQEAIEKLEAALRRVARKREAKVTANVGQAVSGLRSVLGLLSQIPSSRTITFRGRIDGSLGRARQLIAGASTARGRAAAFPDQDVFSAEQDVERRRAELDALQRRFEQIDRARERRALERRADTRRLRGKSGAERDRIEEDIKRARQELRRFNMEARRARDLSRLELRIERAEQIARAKQAIADLREEMKGLAADAAEQFRQQREREIDDRLKAELAAIDASAEAQELANLRAAQQADQRAREDEENQKRLAEAKAKLERAERSRSARLIAEAQAEVAEAERAIADTARERRIDELEAALETKREEASNRADIAREGIDAEVDAYRAGLEQQLTDLVANLDQRRATYQQFVKDVQRILAPLGVDFTGSAQQQADIEVTVRPRRSRSRRRSARRRQHGGLVHEDFTLVGETGVELVQLPHGSRVHSAGQTRRIAEELRRGSPGGTDRRPIQMVNNYYGRGPTANQVADRLGFMVERL